MSMNEIDRAMRVVIRDLADEVPPRPALASTALAAGRRIRFRRRLGATVTGLVVAASVTAGLPYLAGAAADQPGRTETAATPRRPGLPVAQGVPGAGQRPELLNSDPRVVHFDIDQSAVPGLRWLGWRTSRFGETLTVGVRVPEKDQAINLQLAHGQVPRPTNLPEPAQTSPTTVGGRPATIERYVMPGMAAHGLGYWQLTWYPANGLHAVVSTQGKSGDVLAAVAGALRFDRAQRCVLPLRMTGLPVRAELASCGVGWQLDGSGWKWSFSVKAPLPLGGVSGSLGGDVPYDYVPNRTVGGKQAAWLEESDSLVIPDYIGKFALQISAQTEAQARSFIDGLSVAGDLKDPSTWPDNPISR
jgi:hypothetical protein